MGNKKIDKQIETKLFSSNSAIVITALKGLKEKGNINYLPMLFNLLKANPEEEVEKEIVNLLGGIKTNAAVPIIIDALQSDEFISIRKKIVTSCWQNGLNYNDYFLTFVDLVINEEWDIGFEAFTVIDNMEISLSEDIIEAAVNKIYAAVKESGEQKKYLLHEILMIIRP